MTEIGGRNGDSIACFAQMAAKTRADVRVVPLASKKNPEPAVGTAAYNVSADVPNAAVIEIKAHHCDRLKARSVAGNVKYQVKCGDAFEITEEEKAEYLNRDMITFWTGGVRDLKFLVRLL